VNVSGENVEEAFLETAKKIYQNIQDGRYVYITISIFCCCAHLFVSKQVIAHLFVSKQVIYCQSLRRESGPIGNGR